MVEPTIRRTRCHQWLSKSLDCLGPDREPHLGRDGHPGIVSTAMEPATAEVDRDLSRAGVNSVSPSADPIVCFENEQAQVGAKGAQMPACRDARRPCSDDGHIDV